MIYAGIGSRETPKDVLFLFVELANIFAKRGYILRSGAADGADKAFERGCDLSSGLKEIYLPWKGFNNNKSNLILSDNRASLIAEIYHPYWNNLSCGGQKLQARNSHQVLGKDLETPCEMIVCYTPSKGGTTQALRIAKDYGIKIFNAYEYKDIQEFKNDVLNYNYSAGTNYE